MQRHGQEATTFRWEGIGWDGMGRRSRKRGLSVSNGEDVELAKVRCRRKVKEEDGVSSMPFKTGRPVGKNTKRVEGIIYGNRDEGQERSINVALARSQC